jgi:di/tricarboxylate transporter
MAAYLNKLGFIGWFSSQVVGLVGGLGLSWQAALGLVTGLYFYSHYFFASGAAHIGAMYTAFLSVAVACGAPGLVAALALGQLSNVMGCLTTYGIGSAPPYYGARARLGRGALLPIVSGFCVALWPAESAFYTDLPTRPPARPPPPGTGFVPQSKWYQLGFIFSLVYLAIWTFVGGAWWKVLGLF